MNQHLHDTFCELRQLPCFRTNSPIPVLIGNMPGQPINHQLIGTDDYCKTPSRRIIFLPQFLKFLD